MDIFEQAAFKNALSESTKTDRVNEVVEDILRCGILREQFVVERQENGYPQIILLMSLEKQLIYAPYLAGYFSVHVTYYENKPLYVSVYPVGDEPGKVEGFTYHWTVGLSSDIKQ